STQVDARLKALERRFQSQLLALTPAQRTLAMIRAAEFVRAGLRGTFRRRFPELSDEEINMKVLAHLTPLRGLE
ncbi:MAG: hypothetical protein KAW49_07030, partial [Anaerolineae bacterium]|nr:hypothetical protein [Anaerolineae bacterium]